MKITNETTHQPELPFFLLEDIRSSVYEMERSNQIIELLIQEIKQRDISDPDTSRKIAELRFGHRAVWIHDSLIPAADYRFSPPGKSFNSNLPTDLFETISNHITRKNLFSSPSGVMVPYFFWIINSSAGWNFTDDQIRTLLDNRWYAAALRHHHVIVIHNGSPDFHVHFPTQLIPIIEKLLGNPGCPTDYMMQFPYSDIDREKIRKIFDLDKGIYQSGELHSAIMMLHDLLYEPPSLDVCGYIGSDDEPEDTDPSSSAEAWSCDDDDDNDDDKISAVSSPHKPSLDRTSPDLPGSVMYYDEPNKTTPDGKWIEEDDDDDIPGTVSRGIQTCRLLKSIRKEIADANNIPYEILKCPEPEGCTGTCPKCEAEVADLSAKIEQKIAAGETVRIPRDYFRTDTAMALSPDPQTISEQNDSNKDSISGSLIPDD